jgi:uncharacterized membrane protein
MDDGWNVMLPQYAECIENQIHVEDKFVLIISTGLLECDQFEV